jgi:hypothetical protein
MTPTKIRERLSEADDTIDPEEYVAALQYVRGHSDQTTRE